LNPTLLPLAMANPGTQPTPLPPDPSSWYAGAARVAFDSLYTRVTTLGMNAARARRLNLEDAEDVTGVASDGLVEAFRSGALAPDASDEALRKWIEPRVHYRTLDLFKARRRDGDNRHQPIEDGESELDPRTITTDPDMGRLELRDALVRTMRDMSEPQQRVAVMVREGMTSQEIADDLGITNGSARNYASRVSKLLRDALGPHYERVSAKRLRWYGAKGNDGRAER
jgi:RNA polymerase sigma factor (sigma-70 family)